MTFLSIVLSILGPVAPIVINTGTEYAIKGVAVVFAFLVIHGVVPTGQASAIITPLNVGIASAVAWLVGEVITLLQAQTRNAAIISSNSAPSGTTVSVAGGKVTLKNRSTVLRSINTRHAGFLLMALIGLSLIGCASPQEPLHITATGIDSAILAETNLVRAGNAQAISIAPKVIASANIASAGLVSWNNDLIAGDTNAIQIAADAVAASAEDLTQQIQFLVVSGAPTNPAMGSAKLVIPAKVTSMIAAQNEAAAKSGKKTFAISDIMTLISLAVDLEPAIVNEVNALLAQDVTQAQATQDVAQVQTDLNSLVAAYTAATASVKKAK